MSKEIRSFSEDRAMPQVVDIETRTIEGYAVVFEKESRVLFDKTKKRFFVEVIKRGAVSNEDLKQWDIKALAEHDPSRLLARSVNGKGSLTLSVDDYGVKYRFEAPNTTDGDTVLELVKRGDLFGSSFAYITDENNNVKYERKTDGTLHREVGKILRMFDVSVVSDPAFFGTDVQARSLDSFFEEEPNEDNKKDIEELRSLIKPINV